MIIVSDTTPIRYLVEIEKVHVLEKLFGQVVIPQKVFSELQMRSTADANSDVREGRSDNRNLRRVVEVE